MKKLATILTLSSLTIAGANAAVTASNLLAFYDFNGNTNDGSGNGANGTLVDGAVISGGGLGYDGAPGNSALDVGGPSGNVVTDPHARMTSTVDMSSATTNNSFSVSFWQYNTGNGAGANAASSTFGLTGPTGVDRGINFHGPWSNGQVYFDHGGPCCTGPNRRNLLPTGGALALLDSWQHFVLLVDNGRKEIWQNGTMIDQQLTGAAAVPAFTNDVIVGAQFNSILSMPGRLDEFAIWDVALDQSEIQALAGGASTLSIIPIPEPSSSLLVLLSGMFLIRRRR